MTHIVMYKFPKGEFKEEYKNQAEEAFAKVKADVPGIINVKVLTNCVDRDVNYDLIVMVDLENEEALNAYLPNPNHKAFSKEMDKYIVDKARIDIK